MGQQFMSYSKGPIIISLVWILVGPRVQSRQDRYIHGSMRH